MDGYVFAVNGKNSLVHFFNFGDTFVQQYMLNRNHAFWKDVLESWLYFMKVYEKQENFRNIFYCIPVRFRQCFYFLLLVLNKTRLDNFKGNFTTPAVSMQMKYMAHFKSSRSIQRNR